MVAITGIHGAVARRLIRRLEEDDRYTRIVLIDQRPPRLPVRRADFYRVDLTEPLADVLLAEILRREEVEVVAHLALHELPLAAAAAERELDKVGTMLLLNAAADCLAQGTPLEAVVALSTAMVYGARPNNPFYLTEDCPLRGGAEPGFVRDKVDVERQLEEFRHECGLRVCVLRPCWTLGAEPSVATLLLRQAPPIAVLGFDPLLQLLDMADLGEAVKQAIDRRRDGCFNLAGRGVLPLSALVEVAGRSALCLPGPLAYLVTGLRWRLQGLGVGISLDYMRHLWVVDAERARAELDFQPRHTTLDVAQAFRALG